MGWVLGILAVLLIIASIVDKGARNRPGLKMEGYFPKGFRPYLSITVGLCIIAVGILIISWDFKYDMEWLGLILFFPGLYFLSGYWDFDPHDPMNFH